MSWTDPKQTTPSIIQIGFGPWGQFMPGDGEVYCAPTSALMALYYLYRNGFTQLAPRDYTGPGDTTAEGLERIVAGLCDTAIGSGTTGYGLPNGINTYLSACGIGPDSVVLTSIENPSIQWILKKIAPNTSDSSDTIALSLFAVGWYEPTSSSPSVNGVKTDWDNFGGHVLVPLEAGGSAGSIWINNAEPWTFYGTTNFPKDNPQQITISNLPSGLTLQYLIPDPSGKNLQSQNYSQVVSTHTNITNNSYAAIIWGGWTWDISADALPTSANYQIATWVPTRSIVFNTNGANFDVIAPLSSDDTAVGLHKHGVGTLLLTNTNALSGATSVDGGVLASNASTSQPFGSGAMALRGTGTLRFSSNQNQDLASGSGATLTIASGATIQLVGPDGGGGSYSLQIGSFDDGSTANMVRELRGTLVLALEAGLAGLGSGQQFIVSGSDGNLPPVENDMVAPYIVGQDIGLLGKFLTYGQNGFQCASTTSSAGIPISSASSDSPYTVENGQVITMEQQAGVAALEMGPNGSLSGEGSVSIGSQAGGTYAGLLMNGGQVTCSDIVVGAAEFLIFGSGAGNNTIGATITGSAGLTMFGPGSVRLTSDNSSTLHGAVHVNSGALISNSSGSAVGTGGITVHPGAIFQVFDSVPGAVTVVNGGSLVLTGGSIAGAVTVSPPGPQSPMPPGTISGSGALTAPATISGNIMAGIGPGILTLDSDSTITSTAFFYWSLYEFKDNTNSSMGTGWNGIAFANGLGTVGLMGQRVTVLLDFSALIKGDPDGIAPFWHTPHVWTIVSDVVGCHMQSGNFEYASGSFGFGWVDGTHDFTLTWTPAKKSRSYLDRLALRFAEEKAAAS